MENIAQWWMSTKEKQIFSPHFRPALTTCNNSWEETAFAKDMRGGILGGCMWPPRFYSCTFCQREFKSAQALGGHMNVHRRDRARLKQYPNSPCSEAINGNQGQLDCSESLATQLSTKVGSPNQEVLSTPDPSSVPSAIMSSNTFPSSNVKVLSTMEHFMMSQYSSDVPREQNRKPCFNSHSDNNDGVLKLLLAPTYSKPPDVKAASEEAGVRLETNLSVAVNSSVDKRSPVEATIDESILHKRHKISVSSPPDFVLSSYSSAGRLSVHSADVILGATPAGIEDLDLELRLGDPQRVL